MKNITKQDAFIKEIEKSFQLNIPHIYSNSFSIALGTGDVIILFKESGNEVATLNLSYTVAKTLSEKLGGIIKHLEKKTGNTIMTTDDVEKFLSKENKNDTVK